MRLSRKHFYLLLSSLFMFVILSACGEEGFEEIVFEDKDSLRILAIGDSIFDSIGDGEEIPDVIGEELGEKVFNRAVGGSYLTLEDEAAEPFFDIRNQYVEPEDGILWDWVVMDGGGNDLNEECGCGACDATLDELITADSDEGALVDFINERTADGIRVLYVGYYGIPATAEFGFDRCGPTVEIYKSRIEAFAATNDLFYYVDAAQLISGEDLEYFQEDHIHPSPLAAEVVGELAANAIRNSN